MTRGGDSLLVPLAIAAALHAGLLAFAWTRPPVERRAPTRPSPTIVRLVTRPRPAPTPAPEPPRVARAEPAPRPPRTPPARPETPPPATPRSGPERAAERAPSPAEPPAPRRFAVSMDAVVPGGAGVAVPATAGPTAARGDPNLPPDVPAGDNAPFARQAASDVTEVDRIPRLLSQPSATDMRSLYPEVARREGVEGDVRLELLVAESGTVRDVRVLDRAGYGFDAVAVELARRMRFEPARRGGRTVAVWLPWTWKFRLDG